MELNLSMSPQSPPFGGRFPPAGGGGRGRPCLAHQDSLTVSMTTKGLTNNPGENNCFLNSAIQVLWHITVFRRSLRNFTGHYCDGDACIFCATTALFKDFRYSGSHSLPPHTLRTALAKCFQAQNRFQLGLMDDAAECFEKILEQMHQNLTGMVDPDTCDKKHCIPHQKFAMTVMENTTCRCGATSEPFCYVELLHYVSAEAIVSQAATTQGTLTFGQLLRRAGAVDDWRECADYSRCGRMVHLQRTLLNSPAVVSIGLIWDSDASHVERIRNVVNSIGLKLTLSEMFDSVLADDARTSVYSLKAVVTYYGKHYSTVCFHGGHQEWVYFDDTIVRTIGSNWSDVKNQFYKGHYQPLLLIYTSDNTSTVDTVQAPGSVVMTADLAVSKTKETAAEKEEEEDLISFDTLKLKSSVQSLQDKPRVLPTPPVTGAPSSTRLPVATDPEASLLVRQSRPAVTTRSTPSADNQDLMSFESIAPWTTQTVVPHPTQPRVLPVPPPQATTRTVSPIPSDDPTGSLVNQPLLMDALHPSSKPQARPNWVHFTPPPSSLTRGPLDGVVVQPPNFHVPSSNRGGSATVQAAHEQTRGGAAAPVNELHPFTREVDRRLYREIMDYWAKAEAVKDTDKMVALLLYKKTYGLIQSLKYDEPHNLSEPVATDLDRFQQQCETAMSALKIALSPSQIRSKCSCCGQLRRLKGGLCRPCELRVMIKK